MTDKSTTSVVQLIYSHDTHELRLHVYNTTKPEVLMLAQMLAIRITRELLQESSNESNGHVQEAELDAQSSSKQP